ncbi:hypothetical protein F183_A49590 [Bryobacterales bacterium F-183]|nr:hypothetical protein F183_A49590 [Bryobacterales bacterium F-183]
MLNRIAATCILLAAVAAGQNSNDTGSEAALRNHIKAAYEARENSDGDAEILAWRSAYLEAFQLKLPDPMYQSLMALDQLFQDNDRPQERVASLRAGADALRKFPGSGPIWAAQADIALACALEDQGKRAEAATLARKALPVLEASYGFRSREYLDTLRMLITMFEEDGNAAASALVAKYKEIERQRDTEPVFGYQPDARIRPLLEKLSASFPKNVIEAHLSLGQISAIADKLPEKNPFRAKALADAGAACLNRKEKVDPKVVALAEGYLRKALEIRERAMGTAVIADTSKLSLEVLHLRRYQEEADILARHYASAGDQKRHLELLERTLGTFERLLGAEHPALAGPLRRLGDFYYGNNNKERVKRIAEGTGKDDARLDKAIGFTRRELTIYEKAFGAEDPILANTLARLGEMYWVKGAEAEAKALDGRATVLRSAQMVGLAPEVTLQQEVKQLRAFLRFEDADEELEIFKKLH